MKRLSILFVVILFILVGCEGSNRILYDASEADKNSDLESEDNMVSVTPIPETKVTEITNSEDSKSTMNYNQVIIDYKFNRKPPIANWSFLSKKLNSLDDANLWGSSLDLRMADMRSLDLSKEFNKLLKLNFDTNTKWPIKLPEGFDPQKILEVGKNPGLGIRYMQEQGITGKGVNIAIIDQPLLLEHMEYGNQIRFYNEVNAYGDASMHGPFVASISVGKTIGVAPEAGVYYIGCYNFKSSDDDLIIDFTYVAEAIDKVLEINKSLPADQKIRAISISAIWCPDNKGYKEITEAIERAQNEGIFVISANLFETNGFWTYSLAKEFLTDPDNPESYFPYDWEPWIQMISQIPGCRSYYEKVFEDNFDSKMLLVPIGSRTYASPTGAEVYSFGTDGGWSLMEPYLAGLYALGCQVDPDITPEKFWEAALETGVPREITKGDRKYPAIMLNPVGLIEILKH